MSDRVNSDTSSDSSEESFYDPELASDSEDFSDGDFNVIDHTQDIEEQLRSRRGI